MSTITAILEPDADGTLHLPLPEELKSAKVKVVATLEAVAPLESPPPKPVEWPDFAARRDRIFPKGPPPGKPLSEIVMEGRGEY